MIQVGDKTTRRLAIYDSVGGGGAKPTVTTVPAEVVYIHPQRRFYVVRCELPGGHFIHQTEYFYPRAIKT